ncbi:jg11347 [Pararge aegeria aegeria]|uniref:Jg11347 protein n=1 Tax=Pararge aegeria aegeria TaxID=348720 RepID=A0A8S4RNI8_9NEOP|nr:jg11347 [Pararge aegeria aegeria]
MKLYTFFAVLFWISIIFVSCIDKRSVKEETTEAGASVDRERTKRSPLTQFYEHFNGVSDTDTEEIPDTSLHGLLRKLIPFLYFSPQDRIVAYAAFDGSSCPTGMVKIFGQCYEEDTDD